MINILELLEKQFEETLQVHFLQHCFATMVKEFCVYSSKNCQYTKKKKVLSKVSVIAELAKY